MTEQNGLERSSATEELRRLLDERGVEWHHTSGSLGIPYTWWHSPTMGEVDATEGADGKLYMVLNLDLTPEQAIEATLGRGTCANMDEETDAEWFTCSECNTELRVHEPFSAFSIHFCPNCGAKVVDA